MSLPDRYLISAMWLTWYVAMSMPRCCQSVAIAAQAPAAWLVAAASRAGRRMAARAPSCSMLARFAACAAIGVACGERCEVTAFGAVGDGVADDTAAIRAALGACSEVVLPWGLRFLSGPLNLTDDQTLRVDGVLLAAPATDLSAYPLLAPLPSYGGCRDTNCFDKGRVVNGSVRGVLRYSPVIGAFGRRNVSIVGTGTVDGQGQGWLLGNRLPGQSSGRCLLVVDRGRGEVRRSETHAGTPEKPCPLHVLPQGAQPGRAGSSFLGKLQLGGWSHRMVRESTPAARF